MDSRPTVILPTLGRKVYFVLGSKDTEIRPSSNGCCDATVVDVHGDGESVNLVIFDAGGMCHVRLFVSFIQDGVEVAEGYAHAHWMPYQINKAKEDAEVGRAPCCSENEAEPESQQEEAAEA